MSRRWECAEADKRPALATLLLRQLHLLARPAGQQLSRVERRRGDLIEESLAADRSATYAAR